MIISVRKMLLLICKRVVWWCFLCCLVSNISEKIWNSGNLWLSDIISCIVWENCSKLFLFKWLKIIVNMFFYSGAVPYYNQIVEIRNFKYLYPRKKESGFSSYTVFSFIFIKLCAYILNIFHSIQNILRIALSQVLVVYL